MSASSSSSGSAGKSTLVFLGVATAASLLLMWEQSQKKKKKTLHRSSGRVLTKEEQYVADSIRINMPPARRMGITVDRVTIRPDTPSQVGSVSLSMPIKGNTNVHGTAFAGSLYSLCVLSAWYTLVCHLREPVGDSHLDRSTVVVQHAEISYKKPLWNVKENEYIVATSFLSTQKEAWDHFIKLLHDTGKTTCNISGEIRVKQEDGSTAAAVEFKALLCVMLPWDN